MSTNVHCFLPCRKGSERVPRKNIKPFARSQHGLIQIKLDQLIKAKKVESIVLSTNDDEILDYARSLNNSKIRLHKRSEDLSSSATSTDDLVGLARSLVESGHILWTHVTSPFVTSAMYDEIVSTYLRTLGEGFDSLMTTNLIHGFLWNEQGPVNYDRNVEKWPRTQTLEPLHEINSAAFLASVEVYDETNDRIGKRPYLFQMDKISSMDIDWPDDFKLAEQMVLGEVAGV